MTWPSASMSWRSSDRPPAFADRFHHLVQAGRALAARRAPAAGFMGEELLETLEHIDDAVASRP